MLAFFSLTSTEPVGTPAKRIVAGCVPTRHSTDGTPHLTQIFQRKYRTPLSRRMFIKRKQNIHWNALNFHKSQLKPLHVAGVRPRKGCIGSRYMKQPSKVSYNCFLFAKNNCFQMPTICFGRYYNVKILTATSVKIYIFLKKVDNLITILLHSRGL